MDTDKVLKEILAREGGFVNHPSDKGGATNFGITIKTLSEWRGKPVTIDDVKNLTQSEAMAIYRKKYVEAPGFHLLPDPLAAQLVDYGVNSGTLLAAHKLQMLLGVEQDGKIGPETLAAVAKQDIIKLNNALVAERVKMFARIVVKAKTQIVFLVGWIERALSFLR